MNEFRTKVHIALGTLEDLCADLPQTTHGLLNTSVDFNQALASLKSAYEDPTPYTISSLVQTIRAFMKSIKPPSRFVPDQR